MPGLFSRGLVEPSQDLLHQQYIYGIYTECSPPKLTYKLTIGSLKTTVSYKKLLKFHGSFGTASMLDGTARSQDYNADGEMVNHGSSTHSVVSLEIETPSA